MSTRKSLYFVLPLVAMILMACGTINIGLNMVRGSGKIVQEDRAVSGFDKVSLQGSGDILLSQGSEEGLTIEADDNLMEYITTEVRNGELVIAFKDNVSLQTTRDIRYHLKVKDLSSISVSGSGDINADAFKTDALRVAVSGSGNVKIDNLDVNRLDIQSSGSGNYDLRGKAGAADVTISGSGKYLAGDLETGDTSITIGGSGEAMVWANTNLKVQISGSGDVSYYGTPSISQSISGSGDVKSLGSK